VQVDLIFDKSIFIVSLENYSDVDSFSNTKIIIENSLSIEDSQKNSLYLLGFTVHSRVHYFSYLFDQSGDDLKFLKFNDEVGVEIIPNPWWEILTIDSNHELRPRIFIYGKLESDREICLTNLLEKIESSRRDHHQSLFESFGASSKRRKTTSDHDSMLTNLLISQSRLKTSTEVCSIF